ncbi:MAG: ArsC family reductase [Gammaproteobacteria bacterium]|nr:MAG: ArsC family reductase [Pseudomonadota bacterium]PIE39012.1 MAG: ArsC family reductase [Gammaproteobacteria bacterium]
MTITLYGIKNCDTIKKARNWLKAHDIEYAFHDYKQSGISRRTLAQWIEQLGLDTVVNKRGTTWRKLSDEDRNKFADSQQQADAIDILQNNPSMIRRPMLVRGDTCLSGFSEEAYGQFFER